MITLTIVIIILITIGWLRRYIKSIKDNKYSINPFDSAPNVGSFLLVISTGFITILLIISIVQLCIKYLP